MWQIVKEALIVASAGLTLAWVIVAMVELHFVQRRPRRVDRPCRRAGVVVRGRGVLGLVVPRRATLVDSVVAIRQE